MGADYFYVSEGTAKVYCLLIFKTVMDVFEAALRLRPSGEGPLHQSFEEVLV